MPDWSGGRPAGAGSRDLPGIPSTSASAAIVQSRPGSRGSEGRAAPPHKLAEGSEGTGVYASSARRTAPNASVEEVPSVDQMTVMARKGQGDAFALSHDSFAGLLPKLPGARVLSGNFQQTGIAVAVPKGRPIALKIASELLEVAKKSGLVRRALDAAGFPEAVAAP